MMKQREKRQKAGTKDTVFHASKARTSFPLNVCALNATKSCCRWEGDRDARPFPSNGSPPIFLWRLYIHYSRLRAAMALDGALGW
ncbi:hypothetical protein Y032_0557g3407 [Ancylostoma ceylanicum]|uniref:Uncharacterized protein n=1 Tax=Ancylostoma ceylanicum TaxID=53326 RepID=A0A016WQ48_9BILA|nr:hypothetical protein Y032_0557g3407 [Ancylostoma ceylanicum]